MQATVVHRLTKGSACVSAEQLQLQLRKALFHRHVSSWAADGGLYILNLFEASVSAVLCSGRIANSEDLRCLLPCSAFLRSHNTILA